MDGLGTLQRGGVMWYRPHHNNPSQDRDLVTGRHKEIPFPFEDRALILRFFARVRFYELRTQAKRIQEAQYPTLVEELDRGSLKQRRSVTLLTAGTHSGCHPPLLSSIPPW